MSLSSYTALAPLDPFTPSAQQPWDARRVQHLYQRLGFSATRQQIEQGLSMTPSELVDSIIDGVLAAAEPVPPYWANWSWDDYDDDFDLYFEHKYDFRLRWLREMIDEGLRAKLAMFWHNHFVTEEDVYSCNSFMWSYYLLLHKYALGNFRTFVEEMGKNPAMLVYLNGNINEAGNPNENYARELMELFTMGEGNGYTQDDIVEVARALTGWRVDMYSCENAVTFDPNRHDPGPKTIFGQTGNWNYSDVHELIFTLRRDQTARYICEKIYRAFVYPKVDDQVVDALAETFKSNNWELAPVFRQLFKSAHFFEDRYINACIKSPLETMVGLFRLCGVTADNEIDEDNLSYLQYMVTEMGQEPFNPVDVAGWPGYRSWLNENTLAFRWNFCAAFLFGLFANSEGIREKLRQLAIDLTSPEESSAERVTQEIIRHFLKRDLDPPLFDAALAYFKGELPENYFTEGIWDVQYEETPYMIINLLYYLTRLPEWQLC